MRKILFSLASLLSATAAAGSFPCGIAEVTVAGGAAQLRFEPRISWHRLDEEGGGWWIAGGKITRITRGGYKDLGETLEVKTGELVSLTDHHATCTFSVDSGPPPALVGELHVFLSGLPPSRRKFHAAVER